MSSGADGKKTTKKGESKAPSIEMVRGGDKAFQEVIDTYTSVVVAFTASWCAPCATFLPHLAVVAAQYPLLKFVEVDIDESPDVADSYGVTKLPAVAFVHLGKTKVLWLGTNPEKVLPYVLSLHKETVAYEEAHTAKKPQQKHAPITVDDDEDDEGSDESDKKKQQHKKEDKSKHRRHHHHHYDSSSDGSQSSSASSSSSDDDSGKHKKKDKKHDRHQHHKKHTHRRHHHDSDDDDNSDSGSAPPLSYGAKWQPTGKQTSSSSQ